MLHKSYYASGWASNQEKGNQKQKSSLAHTSLTVLFLSPLTSKLTKKTLRFVILIPSPFPHFLHNKQNQKKPKDQKTWTNLKWSCCANQVKEKRLKLKWRRRKGERGRRIEQWRSSFAAPLQFPEQNRQMKSILQRMPEERLERQRRERGKF